MHDIVSIICFQVMSAIVLAPKRIALSSSTVKSSGSSRPRERVRPNQTLIAAVAMWRCFECGRYARKPTTSRTCAQTKIRSRASAQLPSPKTCAIAFETGDQRGGPLVQAGGDQRRVPEQQRQHDQRDQPEDEVGLAEVAALEPLRPLHLADPERGGDADEHEHDEEVDEEREPALRSEPRQRLALRDRADQRHHDRREEDEEAPEDERVDEAGAEALEQLLLAEHDDRLVAHPLRHVVEPLHRLAEPDEAGEQERAAAEQRARDAEDDEEGEGGDGAVLI